MHDEAGEHLGTHRVQRELERGHDAEVAATAADAPEQIGVLLGARSQPAVPSAVTTSAEMRLSIVSPCLRLSQPNPPPSVSPAMPVVELMPTGSARP